MPSDRTAATAGSRGPEYCSSIRSVGTIIETVTQAKTHSALGSDAARAGPSRRSSVTGAAGLSSPSAARRAAPHEGPGSGTRKQSSAKTAVSTTGTAKARWAPVRPDTAHAMRAVATGPTAKPLVSTTPARAAPFVSSWSAAHAVPALATMPTPSPTTSQPTVTPGSVDEASMTRLPRPAWTVKCKDCGHEITLGETMSIFRGEPDDK